MLIVPKVTMIGANFILLISIPLRNPSKVPTIAPVNRDNIGLTPEVDNLAIVSAVIPKIEPAETSIPPVIRARAWTMKAEGSDTRNYDLLMTSAGLRCKNKTKSLVTYTGCGSVSAGREEW